MRLLRPAVPASLLLALFAGACGRGEPDPEPQAADAPVVEGLSQEQLEATAEPMTPEMAEQLGIVDTSIHVERQLSSEDSLLLTDTLSRPDTILP